MKHRHILLFSEKLFHLCPKKKHWNPEKSYLSHGTVDLLIANLNGNIRCIDISVHSTCTLKYIQRVSVSDRYSFEHITCIRHVLFDILNVSAVHILMTYLLPAVGIAQTSYGQ